MATANPSANVSSGRRWLRRTAWALAFALGALLAAYWQPLRQTALAGAAFGARIGCSCHYIAGRPLGDCRKDFEPRMSLIYLSADDETQSVTARFHLLASQTATLRAGEGCVLEPWRD